MSQQPDPGPSGPNDAVDEPGTRAAAIVWDRAATQRGPNSWEGPPAFGNHTSGATAETPPHEGDAAPEEDAQPEPAPTPSPLEPEPSSGVAPVGAASTSAAPDHKPAPVPAAVVAEPPTRDEPDASDDDALTIGRSRGNSIVLDDMLVSRKHLRITADDEGLLLEDLHSRNGTFVNGRRVERTRLHEGDRIGVGAAIFEVRDGWLVTI